jgi:hypothetical protein
MSPRRGADPTWIRIAERVYAGAVVLFPKPFRDEYGACLRQAFRDRCREVANGKHHAVRVLALEVAPDLVATLGRERMQAGMEGITLRHTLLMGCLGLAFAGLVGRDAITPPVLNAAVSARNRVNDFIDLRRIQAREATARRIAESLAAAPDAGSRALAALLYRSIAQRKEHPFFFPDDQSESMYHRPAESADAENARIRQLVGAVVSDRDAGGFALARAAESCDPADHCDRARLAARLMHADSDNGYAWALEFAQADARGDEPGRRIALSGLARADRYEMDEGQTARRLLQAANAIGVADDEATTQLVRSATEASLLEDLPVPAYYCARHALAAGADRSAASASQLALTNDCYRGFGLMAHSTSLRASLIGWHLIARWNDEPAFRAQARDALRDRYWLAGARFEHDRMSFDDAGGFQSAADRHAWRVAFAPGDGQIPSLRRWFIARGMPAHAPRDYLVPDQYLIRPAH